MIELIIDTTTNSNLIGIFKDGKSLADFKSDKDSPRDANDELMKITDELLEKTKLSIEEIERIIVILGPGSYTGSRSGLAFTKAISQVTQANLYGISRLDVIASKGINAFPTEIAVNSREKLQYVKKYEFEEDLYFKRDEGKVEELSDTKDYEVLSNEVNIKDIQGYAVEYIKHNKPDDFLTLLPVYLKEPNITQPK